MRVQSVILCMTIALIAVLTSTVQAQGRRVTRNESVSPSKVLSGKEVYDRYSRSVVTLRTKTGSGTGFFDADGKLFTCWHVVKDASEVEVQFSDGKKVMAYWVQHVNVDADIAVLVTSFYQGWEKYESGPKLGDWAGTKVGEALYVMGSPLGLDGTLTAGMVSSKRQMERYELLQLSAAISPGSSGSPILNDRGEVIGMVTSALKSGQSLNFGVSVKDLKDVFGVPLAYVVSGGTDAPASSNLDSLLLNPVFSKNLSPQLRNLGPISVLVEEVPEALKKAVSVQDLRSWTEINCRSEGFTVISQAEQDAKFMRSPVPSDERMALKTQDEFGSQCYVNVNALKQTDGTISYSIRVEITRGALVFPGQFLNVTVLSKSTLGFFGSAYDPGTRVKEVISDLIAQLGKELKRANS